MHNINRKEFVLFLTNSSLKSLQFDNTALATALALALPLAGNLFCFSTTLCDLVAGGLLIFCSAGLSAMSSGAFVKFGCSLGKNFFETRANLAFYFRFFIIFVFQPFGWMRPELTNSRPLRLMKSPNNLWNVTLGVLLPSGEYKMPSTSTSYPVVNAQRTVTVACDHID